MQVSSFEIEVAFKGDLVNTKKMRENRVVSVFLDNWLDQNNLFILLGLPNAHCT